MRVLLIFSPSFTPSRREFDTSVGFPLGIAYVAAVAEKNGIEVSVMDAQQEGLISADLEPETDARIRISHGMFQINRFESEEFSRDSFYAGAPLETIMQRVEDTRPDVVGISCIFSSQYLVALEIAKAVKTVNASIVTAFGGGHPTVDPEGTLANSCVDFVIMGEGEESFSNFVSAYSRSRIDDVEKMPGICFRKGKKVVAHPFVLIDDLDRLPMPAYHLFDMESYFRSSAEGRTAKLITSRGCVFDCCFCSVPSISRRRFRARSPENVLEEVTYLIKNYGIEGIMFEDDNLTTDMKRAKALFRLIIDGHLGLTLYARNFRADLLDAELLNLMKEAGFKTIWITPESGNERVLRDVIGKKMSLLTINRAVKMILDSGLQCAAAFVIGFPGETMKEIQDTINYARRLKVMDVEEFWFSIARPIMGTRLYEEAVEKRLIYGMDYKHFSYTSGAYDTGEFKARELVTLRDGIMSELNAKERRKGR